MIVDTRSRRPRFSTAALATSLSPPRLVPGEEDSKDIIAAGLFGLDDDMSVPENNALKSTEDMPADADDADMSPVCMCVCVCVCVCVCE